MPPQHNIKAQLISSKAVTAQLVKQIEQIQAVLTAAIQEK
jgi:hypothetical protein